jgi:RNase P subunit RPR2
MQKQGKLYYISRRSLCDNCKIIGCPDRNCHDKCESFSPSEFLFVKCTECGQIFEVHSARKSDAGDICPTCKMTPQRKKHHGTDKNK